MRVGVLGGTFDPVHVGHLWMAEAARDQLDLDRVLLIPASRPPHKTDRDTTNYGDRVAMLRLSIAGCPGLEVSEIERDESRPSYTAETLARLHAERPGDELWLILGGDSLRDLPTWRAPEEIVKLASLAVLPRPGIDPTDVSSLGARVVMLDGPELAISSTELRARLRVGRSVRYLVPDGARKWIERHHTYGREGNARG